MDAQLSLSLLAQTAYAQLLDALISQELTRSIGALRGSFVSKMVKGHRYWYFASRMDSASTQQVYLGAESPALLRQIEQFRQERQGATELKKLGEVCVLHGCQTTDRPHLRLLARLSDAGAFRAGGVVVGTHAFNAYAAMLGVRWLQSTKTNDIDIAHAGRSLAVALPAQTTADLHQVLTLQNGFLPSLLLNGKAGVTYRAANEATFQVDFLTTLGRNAGPQHIAALNVLAQPMKFMEYLLSDMQRAAVLDDSGRAALVQVPQPSRFAAHKLIVSANRPIEQQTKSRKDLQQVLALAEVLDEDDLTEAISEAAKNGPGWASRIKKSLRKIQRQHWLA